MANFEGVLQGAPLLARAKKDFAPYRSKIFFSFRGGGDQFEKSSNIV
jgi:hypothetical protein